MKGLRVFRGLRPVVAAVAAVALGVGIGGVGPAVSAAAAQTASASLSRPVVVPSCSGTPQVCSVGVVSGVVGFPVSVTSRVTSGPGTAPAGDWVSVSYAGFSFAGGWVGRDGAFSNIWPAAGLAPGHIATISWTAPEAVTVTAAGQVAGAIRAAGLSSGEYTLAATVTPWSATLSGPNTADFVSLSGRYAGATPDTASIVVTSPQSESIPTISVTDNGKTTAYTGTYSSYTTDASYSVTLGGSGFSLVVSGSGANGDAFDLKINPTSTAFALTSGSSNAYGSAEGLLDTNQSVSISMGGGAAGFDVGSTVVGDTVDALYTQIGTTPPTLLTQPDATSFQVG